jgi:uncharacterized membrane protein
VAILVAFALVIISIMVLVLYANHIGRKLRAASLIEAVGSQIRSKVDELYPDELCAARARPDILIAPRPGVLVHIEADRLIDLASKADVMLNVLPALGDFVPAGAALVRVEGVPRQDIAAEVLRRITLDTERSITQDLAYGPRLLVDICVRSLGEPFDPTTAVQAIDRIHDFLRRLSTRKFPTGEYPDEAGAVRLVVRTLTWDDYVRLSLEEIRIGSGSSVQATRRLRYCLEDLLHYAPEERRGPIERQLNLLDAEIDHSDELGGDLTEAQESDPQGLGRSRGRAARE